MNGSLSFGPQLFGNGVEFLCGLGPPPSQLNLTEYSSASYGVRVDGNAAFSSAVCYCPDVDIDNSGGSCDGPADYVQPVGRLLVFGTRLCGDDVFGGESAAGIAWSHWRPTLDPTDSPNGAG